MDIPLLAHQDQIRLTLEGVRKGFLGRFANQARGEERDDDRIGENKADSRGSHVSLEGWEADGSVSL
jgi:hypothetical protein